MATAIAHAGSRYELPLLTEQEHSSEAARRFASSGFPVRLLVANALWFCRLRWVVVAVFAGGGLVSLSPHLVAHLGLRARPGWLLLTAAALAIVNTGFSLHGRRLARAEPPLGADANLWAQIVFDLLVLTTVVHHVGSLETYIPFAYLFHIVLACIFFPRRWSLAVTLLAASLYVGCVAIEETRALPTMGMVVDAGVRSAIDRLPGLQMLHVGCALVTWGVIWYLTSHLSAAVRDRDRRLTTTNARLMAAQRERARHMLHTTHELKAPFAAIHAGVHMVLRGHCGQLPEEMADVLSRVAARCGQLAEEIQQMLQ
ncbi:hypothetical protein HQ560_01395, partial [bacterium]|nr:hypothetical protein [bacterium]